MKRIMTLLCLLYLNNGTIAAEKTVQFNDLPEDMVLEILRQPDTLQEAIANIFTLSRSDKKNQQKINQQSFKNKLIDDLAKKYTAPKDFVKLLISLMDDKNNQEVIMKRALETYPNLLKNKDNLTIFTDILAKRFNKMPLQILNEFSDIAYDKGLDQKTTEDLQNSLKEYSQTLLAKKDFMTMVTEYSKRYKLDPLFVSLQVYKLWCNANDVTDPKGAFFNEYLNYPKYKHFFNHLKDYIIKNPDSLYTFPFVVGFRFNVHAEKFIDDLAKAFKMPRWELAIDMLLKIDRYIRFIDINGPINRYLWAQGLILNYLSKRPAAKVKAKQYINQHPNKFNNAQNILDGINNKVYEYDIDEYLNQMPELFKTREQVYEWLDAA